MDDRTRSALLALAENANDAGAQAALYGENTASIEAAMRHWFGGPHHDSATKTVILRIAKRACYYYPYEDARAWVVSCADLECRRLKNETEHCSRHWGRAPVRFEAGSRQTHC